MPQGRIKTCIMSYLRKILTEKAALCEAREGATGGMARSYTWKRPFPRVASAFATRGKTHSITTDFAPNCDSFVSISHRVSTFLT